MLGKQIYQLLTLKCDGEEFFGIRTLMNPRFQEKLLGLILQVPVLRTDTGSQGENPKVSEITMVKELGKMTP